MGTNLLNPDVIFAEEGGIPTDGLDAYYPFNGNHNDESGNGYNLTNVGATLTTDRNAESDKAYNFVRTTQYMHHADNADFRYTSGNSKSFSFWFQRIGTTGAVQAVLSKWNATNQREYIFYTNGLLFTVGVNGNSNVTASRPTITLGTWHHIVVTMDGSGNVLLYFDGSLFSSGTASSFRSDPSEQFFLGRNSSVNNFNGKQDDIRMYNNKILTPDEVTALNDE